MFLFFRLIVDKMPHRGQCTAINSIRIEQSRMLHHIHVYFTNISRRHTIILILGIGYASVLARILKKKVIASPTNETLCAIPIENKAPVIEHCKIFHLLQLIINSDHSGSNGSLWVGGEGFWGLLLRAGPGKVTRLFTFTKLVVQFSN